MAALVGDLVDPDPPQPVESINGRVDVRVDPGDDRPDRAPRHPQQLRHCAFRGADRQPGREVIEVTRMARAVTCPRHRRDRHAMRAAPNAWRTRLEKHLRRAQIKGPPTATAFPQVITR